VYGVEGCKIVFLGELAIHWLRHICRRMYRLAAILSVTDRQTDGHSNGQTAVLCQ